MESSDAEKKPSSATARMEELRRRNKTFGLTLASVAASIFVIAILIAMLVHYAANHPLFAAR